MARGMTPKSTPDNTIEPEIKSGSGTAKQLQVFLADDHQMFLQGLQVMLGREADMAIIGHASNGQEVVEQVRKVHPDVLVLDITMPGLNGVEVCRQLCRDTVHPAILILSVHNDEEYISQAITAGAAGYLLKEAAAEDLTQAIRKVAMGQFYLGDNIPASAMARVAQSAGDPYESLSPRERDVLRFAAEGKGNREIGEALCIGPKTVDTHKRRLMKKLSLDTSMDMLKFAIRRGLIRL
ncbi:MAG: response regulator transcription factor [Phycisphaerae bacterium]